MSSWVGKEGMRSTPQLIASSEASGMPSPPIPAEAEAWVWGLPPSWSASLLASPFTGPCSTLSLAGSLLFDSNRVSVLKVLRAHCSLLSVNQAVKAS